MIVNTSTGLKTHESDNGVVTLCGRKVNHIYKSSVERGVPVAAIVDRRFVLTGEVADLVPPEVDCRRCLAALRR
jgi:hypothetical protein